MCRFPRALLSCFTLSLITTTLTTTCIAQNSVISVGVPLHIVLNERTSYTKAGQPLRGHLSQPVYVFDHVALPAGTEVLGKVAEVHPVSKGKRFNALASGDFTPLREADVQFYSIVLNDGREIPIQSAGAVRDSAVVRMGSSAQHHGLWKQAKDSVKDEVTTQKRSFDEAIHRPNKLQWAKNSLLARLPYHPQVYEAGTQFVAELQSPIEVPSNPAPRVNLDQLGSKVPEDSVLHARLNSDLSSAANKWGDQVEATLTEPLLTQDHKLILPEGTQLLGAVTRVKPAERWGRNGQLSFTFRQVKLPSGVSQPVKGILSASEGGSRVKIDEEGNVHASEPKAKYLVPLAVVVTAQSVSEGDGDGIAGSSSINNGVAGGGFGLTGRILSLSLGSRGFAYGLGYYGASRSIYSRFIARGHNVVFPKDTQIEIKVGSR
jgi:hypothetical protein